MAEETIQRPTDDSNPAGEQERTHVFIVGRQRSGTIWLHLLLGRHPDVGTVKEAYLLNQYVARMAECREAARRWSRHVLGAPEARSLTDHNRDIRYENLWSEPVENFAELLDWVGLGYDEEFLRRSVRETSISKLEEGEADDLSWDTGEEQDNGRDPRGRRSLPVPPGDTSPVGRERHLRGRRRPPRSGVGRGAWRPRGPRAPVFGESWGDRTRRTPPGRGAADPRAGEHTLPLPSGGDDRGRRHDDRTAERSSRDGTAPSPTAAEGARC